MKNQSVVLFPGLSIAAVLALSSTSQGQTLYWDTNGTLTTPTPFGDFVGNWNGSVANWNADATGGAVGGLTALTTSSNALVIAGGGTTGAITLSPSQAAGSIDFANTANTAVITVSNGANLTVTGAITDSGAGTGEIRVLNTTQASAASKLTASSITIGNLDLGIGATTGQSHFLTTGYNVTVAGNFYVGNAIGNATYTQTAGTITLNNSGAGLNLGAVNTDATNAPLSTATYIMDGGTLKTNRIGVGDTGGNNFRQSRFATNGIYVFNSGTIESLATNSTLNFQNAFTMVNSAGGNEFVAGKDMQYNTSKPLTVQLAETGTHTLNANGATGLIIVTPSAQFVNKSGEAGTLNKTGLGNLVFTGGGPVAVNSYTGATTVTAGKVMTDYSIVGGQAATGGTDSLTNGYSAASQLVLNGGNYELVGRSSASASNLTGIVLTRTGLIINVSSSAGLVVGQSVTNSNLPAGTYIRRIISPTQIELSAFGSFTGGGGGDTVTGQTLNLGAGTFANTQTINSVDLLQDATVTVTPSAGSSTTLLSFGNVTGSGKLTKAGTGTLALTGSLTHSGHTDVSAGTLLVNGSLGDTAMTVASGATLGGSGTIGTSTVLNTLTVNGTIGPGNSPGILTVNDNLDLNGALRAELQGTTAGTGHDQLVVNGAVEIGGSTLSARFETFTPVSGTLLFILINDGTDPISGTFTNLAQNATVLSYGGYHWKISYNADSTANTFTGTPNGNDIALMAVPIAGDLLATTDEGSLNRYLWRLRFHVPENIDPQTDEDGDGASNLDEARSLTNPFDPQSKFAIQSFTTVGSNLQLTWSSEKGLGYVLQSSPDLKTWKNEGNSRVGTGAEMLQSITDPNLLASNRLFLRFTAIQNVDTDNDGLMDWQEEIIGANPDASASLRAAIRGGDAAHFEALMQGANPFGGRAGTTEQGVPSEENASRFLSQASMGPTPESIQAIQALGYEAWINDQFTKSLDVSGKPNDRLQKYIDWIIENRSYGDVPYYNFDTRADMPCQNVTTSWLRNALWSDAQLRQRVTWALSQIFVVSARADLFEGRGDMLANFYDTLSQGAFGNYEDLLLQVAIHPAMGVYLSHIFNLKADQAINRYPDENFAREIMQLFSIGLNQLNPDGTPVLDSNGQEIQTYSTEDIKEMARVFTGLQLNGRPWGSLVGGTHPSLSQPMVVNSLYHDPNSKRMPDGTILPANPDGMATIQNAVAWLSDHPNTAPFISRRLIQFLVTSNPTPAYIQRVSSIFANDGSGTRGNLGAVVKAILLDPEARGLNYLIDPYFGRLKEPMLRLTNTARVLEAGKAAGPAIDLSSFQFWNYPGELGYSQYPMHAPSVFNFYDLRYQMPGEVTDLNLLSPEFQILDSVTATSVINRNIKNLWTGNYNDFHGSWAAVNGPVNDWSKLIAKSGEVDTDSFCDHVLLLWGANHSVSYRTREEMKKAVNYQASPTNDQKAHNAAIFALTAPECAIQR